MRLANRFVRFFHYNERCEQQNFEKGDVIMSHFRNWLPKMWKDPDSDPYEALFGASWPFLKEKKWFDVDVHETESEVIVEAELPGFQKEDIQIELEDRYITITAERSKEDEQHDEDKRYYRRERFYGKVQRTIALPAEIKEETAKAKCKNGVLIIKAEKKVVSSPKKRILEIE